jgi:subtilisin family serine protease
MAREYGIAQPGQGMRIAIIDNGIVPAHPSFNDAGYVAPSGFPVSQIVRGDSRSPLPPGSANNKVIVGNIYASPEDIYYTRAFYEPESIHGPLVAAVAAGVPVRLPAAGSSITVQGVAPYAYLINLAVPGDLPEYLAAIDDAARYGADIVNISRGTTIWLGWSE